MNMMGGFGFIGIFVSLLPLIILAFVLRWIRIIKINSEIQVEQNKEMINLLHQINENHKNS